MSIATRSDYTMIAYYASLEEATEAEKAFAIRNGYCLKIRRTQTIGNRTGGLIKGRTLVCVHSRKINSDSQVRDTSKLRHDCPFQVRIFREGGDSWSTKITVLEHNHEPANILPPETPDFAALMSQLQREYDLLPPHQQQPFVRSIKEVLDRSIHARNPIIAPTQDRLIEPARRNPSSLEPAGKTHLPQRSSCRICNVSGHNSRTCPQKIAATSSQSLAS